MRLAFVALVLPVLLALPASAASVDPKALVIRPSDVPAGYVLTRGESGLRTNEQEAKESAEAGRVFRRLGRVTGYQRIFEGRDERTIEARADVFGSPESAREMLRFAEREARLAGIRGLRRARAGIGAEGWVFYVHSSRESYVYWRYRSVWAALGGRGLAKEQALALARVQQRRMVTALG